MVDIEHKSTQFAKMQAARHRQIETLLRTMGTCTVDFLARELAVSDMTIRRDLRQLADAGRIVRSHGGAAPAEQVLFEFQFLQRTQIAKQQKEEIATTAAELVRDGQSVLLDSGTTTLALARRLVDRRGVTVITTSLPIASVLQRSAGVETLLLGGFLRRDTPDLGGPLTESNLDSLRADLAFVGADGVDVAGNVYNASIGIGQMLGKMASRAAEAYVVADSTKFGRTQLKQFGNAANWRGLITDRGISPATLDALRNAGVNVIVSEPVVRAGGNDD
jgi:DeoR/GlpR family transcriptional regulator of sugar metabolism